MQLAIRHETSYHYSVPLNYTIQQLRLTPRSESQQRIVAWQIDMPGKHHAYTDAYGNLSHMLTLSTPHSALCIVAHGLVETTFPYRGRMIDENTLSPLIFTIPTRLTEPTNHIIAFAQGILPQQPDQVQTEHLLTLAQHILGQVAYQSGATMVTTTAHDALQLGFGVCQDHAHLFLACCHSKSIPARYVSGYIDPGSGEHAASHAWVDVWVHDDDFSGWVSIDVTHARLMSDAYCRLAIGRDYDSAAPIHGVRHGGGEETLQVSVQVVAT
jgi:transglutaminase-like putative cysteine protease